MDVGTSCPTLPVDHCSPVSVHASLSHMDGTAETLALVFTQGPLLVHRRDILYVGTDDVRTVAYLGRIYRSVQGHRSKVKVIMVSVTSWSSTTVDLSEILHSMANLISPCFHAFNFTNTNLDRFFKYLC